MKKSLIFVGMLAVGYANAQYDGKVGVNTETPSATFNVKSKTGNNATTKNFELENADGTKMVTVLDNGKIGIGKDNPEANVDVLFSQSDLVSVFNIRNINTNSRNHFSLNTGEATTVGRNTLGFSLSGKDYTHSTPSISGNNAVIYSTTSNGLNFQIHQKDAKYKFYTGGLGEGALTMSILPHRVGIATSDNVGDILSTLTIGENALSTVANKANKIGLLSSSVDGENLITYYDSNKVEDAQIGIDTKNKNQFQIKIYDDNKHFGIYEHGATSLTLNNGFLRIGLQSGEIPAMLTLDGRSTFINEQIGIRFQSSGMTSTYGTIFFNREEIGGMRFKLTHNKHNYQFDTNKIENALRIEAEGNIGIGTASPSEKLEVIGNIKSSSLAGVGNRAVYADENGVLKVGNAYTANTTNSLWTRDEATNTIKLAVNSDGTDRTNAVTIDNAGAVYASSLKGYNGATIFPDYVFQKYYTGNSSIKADYTFKTLSQVEDFVKTNGHLPGYKSAAAIKAQGYVDLMETQLTNVEKIEELYLHSIEQDKTNKVQAEELKTQAQEIETLRKENEDLKARLEKLEKLLK
ncbi:hypothetical protein ACFFUE_08260 [Bergeyella porcorum]|uniref:hypothetical protein n=1 Tax=Bergeyella porcorum TaxID=1735111 RepID=UPI0035ECC7BE